MTAWGNPDSKTATGAYASYSRGICGLMLDAPQDISELPYNLKAEKEYEVALGKTEELMAVLQKYAGEERVQCGYKLLSGTLEKEGDTALAVLTCTTETPAGEFTYVSETVTLRAVSSGDKKRQKRLRFLDGGIRCDGGAAYIYGRSKIEKKIK